MPEPPTKRVRGDSLYDDSSDSEVEIVEARPAGEQQPSDNSSSSTNISDPKENMIGNLKCPICLDTPDVIAVADCGHIYCRDCIFIALSGSARADKVKGECSVCRQKVRYDATWFPQLKLKRELPLPIDSVAHQS